MPFQSEAQRRYMHAKHPQMAKEWESHTSDKQRKKMPYKVSKLSGYDYTDKKGGYTLASRVGYLPDKPGGAGQIWEHKNKAGRVYRTGEPPRKGVPEQNYKGPYRRYATAQDKKFNVHDVPGRPGQPKKVRHGFLKLRSKTVMQGGSPGYKIKYVDDVAKGHFRETQRTGATGALGAAIFTRGRLKPTLKWGAGGAAMGGGADIVRARRRRRTESELQVIKAYRPGDQLYRKETRISPWRATEALAGVTLMAAGGSRLKMLGGGIKAGTKLKGNRSLPFERAQSVRNAAQKGTRQVGPTLRRSATMSGTMDLIPGRLRPAAATVGGAAMIGHARPVKREKYVPTNRRR